MQIVKKPIPSILLGVMPMSIVIRDIATRHAKKVPVGITVSVRAMILIRLIYFSGVHRRR